MGISMAKRGSTTTATKRKLQEEAGGTERNPPQVELYWPGASDDDPCENVVGNSWAKYCVYYETKTNC